MARVVLLFLFGCAQTRRPVDLLPPGGIYCQPLTDYHQRCRDYTGRAYLCTDSGGRWRCSPESAR